MEVVGRDKMSRLNFVISIFGDVAVIIIFGEYLSIVGCDVIGNQPTKVSLVYPAFRETNLVTYDAMNRNLARLLKVIMRFSKQKEPKGRYYWED